MDRKDTSRAEWLREQIRSIESLLKSETVRLREYRRLLSLEVTGKPAPSHKSTAARPNVAIKKILAQGPATRDEILKGLEAEFFDFKEEPGITVDKALIMCVKAGTIVQEGDRYRLPGGPELLR